MRTIVVCVWAVLWFGVGQAFALPPQSNHGVLKAVPAPGAVVVDGKLDEWDTSGEMLVYGVRKIRERYSVRVHAMWDAQAFYLGMKFRDPSPLINNVDADGAPGDGWMADSFQGRFVTDYPQVHLTAWYSSKKDKSVAQLNYNSAVDANGMRVFRGGGKVLKDGSGFEQAFLLDADQRGYSHELRIPWAMLFKQPAPKAGLKFGFTGEYFWGGLSGTTWPAVMTDYLLTASIPWTSLGIKPQAGQSLIADLGLLFSDDTGATTAQRIHWVDPETNVVNDTPTEVEFAPARWGTWELLGADGKKVSRTEP